MVFLFMKVPFIRDSQCTSSKRVENTPLLAWEWWEFAWRYRWVWVFLWNTLWEKEPSSFFKMRTSRKGSHPSTSCSIVNFMEEAWLLRCWKNRSNSSWPWGQMTLVSCTNLFHSFGKRWVDAKALDSKSSIKILATTRDKREPMAPPQVCS